MLDEFADALLGIDDIAIGSAIDFFVLQRSHEALSLGIIIRVANPAHARLDAMCRKSCSVFSAGILGRDHCGG
jgi:hypothetical protein